MDTVNIFNQKYVGDKFIPTLVKNVNGVATNIMPAANEWYGLFKQLVDKPVVNKFRIPLGVYESANIDFTKPAYIGEFGCNCLILSVLADNEGMCEVKVLLINKTLV